jgi:hypothetical protein
MTFSAPYSNRSNGTVHRSLQESSNRHCTHFGYLSEQDAKMDRVQLRTSISSTTALFFFYQSEAGRLNIYMPERLQASDRNEHRKGEKEILENIKIPYTKISELSRPFSKFPVLTESFNHVFE